MRTDSSKQPAKSKLTVRLSRESIEFLKEYAQRHGLTVTDMIRRYLERIRRREEEIHPEVERISGLIPDTVDAESDYAEYMVEKHR